MDEDGGYNIWLDDDEEFTWLEVEEDVIEALILIEEEARMNDLITRYGREFDDIHLS